MRHVPARALSILTLVLAIAAVALAFFGSEDPYELRLAMDNASQLVKGNEVKVGGVPVGTIAEIELGEDSRAEMRLEVHDDDLTPFHEGTTAVVRSSSLSGIANRYIALQPGPQSNPELDEGQWIPGEDVSTEVDLDAIINTFGPGTRTNLKSGVVNTGRALRGAERRANAGIEAFNPFLSQSAATAAELTRDTRKFERFLVESAGAATAAASRPADLDQLVGNAMRATEAVAGESVALDRTLGNLPPVLRRTNSTLVNLRGFARDLRPAVREARPAARPLSDFLSQLDPLARDARPLIRRLRRAIRRPGEANDLLEVLRGLPPVDAQASPAFKSADQTLADSMPIIEDTRPYTPDFVGGFLNGFGGTTAGYYDANGHYARIGVQASVYSVNNQGSVVPVPASEGGLSGYRKKVWKRCPGAATQPAPDGSNPFLDRDGFPCAPEDSAR